MPLNFHKQVLIRKIAGGIMLIAGLAGLILPVVPGWLLIGAGLLLLAPRVRPLRRLMVWIYIRYPAARGRLRAFRKIIHARPPRARGSGKRPAVRPPG